MFQWVFLWFPYVPTMWGPLLTCWFVTPSNSGYNYHKPEREIVVLNQLNSIERVPHIVAIEHGHRNSEFSHETVWVFIVISHYIRVYQMVNLHFPMVFLWFPHFPMGFLRVFLWFSTAFFGCRFIQVGFPPRPVLTSVAGREHRGGRGGDWWRDWNGPGGWMVMVITDDVMVKIYSIWTIIDTPNWYHIIH